MSPSQPSARALLRLMPYFSMTEKSKRPDPEGQVFYDEIKTPRMRADEKSLRLEFPVRKNRQRLPASSRTIHGKSIYISPIGLFFHYNFKTFPIFIIADKGAGHVIEFFGKRAELYFDR